MKEREQSTQTESLSEKTKRWFWKGVGILALAVGAVVVINHLPQIINWAGRAIQHA